MITRKKAVCACGCGNEGWIYAKGMLQYCYWKSKGKKTIKPVSEKRKERIKSGNGELVLFQAIWATRPHKCQVTGEPIKFFNVRNFMHVLSKGAYGKFRLLDRNILLVAEWVHDEYDNGDRTKPLFEKVNKLHDELVKQYYTKSN